MNLKIKSTLTSIIIALVSTLSMNAQNADAKSTELLDALITVNGGYQTLAAKKDVQFNYVYDNFEKGKDVSTERHIFDGEHSWASYEQHDLNVMPGTEGVALQSYVDNKVSDLDEELRKEIDNVKLTAGVSRIVAGQNITLSPNDGLGDVTITSSPVIQNYNLPSATTTSLGGVKVSGISGTTSNIIGIDSNKKLTIQDSTNNKKGANYKGQCCVQGGGNINSADYKQGQLIWHQAKGVLFLAT